MAERIILHYFLCTSRGSPVACSSRIIIHLDQHVPDLEHAIEQAENRRGQIHLWKPMAFLSKDGLEDLRQRLEKAGSLSGFCISLRPDEYGMMTVADLLAGQRSTRGATRTALVVELLDPPPPLPALGEGVEGSGDALTQMRKRFKYTLSESRKATPSVSSKPLNYREYQNGLAPILDGRYGVTQNPLALPVEIHHSAFAYFTALAQDTKRELPDDIIGLTIQLTDATSRIVTTEMERQTTTRDLLSKILQFPIIQIVHQNRTSPDHAAIYSRPGSDPIGAAALAIVEEKVELGISGDPATQGSFSYLQHWTDPGQKEFMEATSCPSFIIAIAGPWLVVLGAVFTSNAIVQRLTDFIWLGNSRVVDDGHTLRLARIFTALRDAVARLETFYKSLSLPVEPDARFFPYATSYVERNGSRRILQLSYRQPLKCLPNPTECVAFLATNSDGKPVVVKFVERYGVEAHEILASSGKAPDLLYHGDVWPGDEIASKGCSPRMMIVMDYIDGETCEDGVPDDVRAAVKAAVECLHSHRLVHGDIRGPNIIIERGEGDEGSRVKLLDFDWSGKEGEARYPLRLTPGLWTDGVGDNQLILPVHDMEMLERLPM